MLEVLKGYFQSPVRNTISFFFIFFKQKNYESFISRVLYFQGLLIGLFADPSIKVALTSQVSFTSFHNFSPDKETLNYLFLNLEDN